VTAPEPKTAEEHLAAAAQLAVYATENNHAGYAPSALAYATTAQVHVSIAQVITAREALAGSHAPVEPEQVPGAALARIHAALAETPP
jgi:hypothetical protein